MAELMQDLFAAHFVFFVTSWFHPPFRAHLIRVRSRESNPVREPQRRWYRRPAAGAVRTALVAAGFELVLARVTSNAVSARDMSISLVGWAVLALVGGGVVGFLSAGWRHPLRAFLGAGIVAGIACGILLPVAADSGAAAVAASVLFLLVLLSGGAVYLRRRDDPFPPPPLVVAVLSISVLAARLFDPGAPPRLDAVLAAAVLWLGLASLARTPFRLAVTVAVAVLIARLPAPPAPVSWSRSGPVPEEPDILLLSIDTLRADVGGEMRSYRWLAERGVRFPHAQSAAPWTLPAMASLHTGESVVTHGAARRTDSFTSIASQVATLAERLAARGYDTAAVVAANAYLQKRFGFARGFDRFEHAFEGRGYALPRGFRMAGVARPILARSSTVILRRTLGMGVSQSSLMAFDDLAEEIVRRGRHVLEARRERPIFLWLHFMDCHGPYRHHRAATHDFDRALQKYRSGETIEPWWTPELRERVWNAYRDEVRYADDAILQLLDEDGPTENPHGSVIVLTSDHGEEFGEHGGLEHGHALHQEVVGIPLVIGDLRPGSSQRRVVSEVVGLADVAPTLLAAAGVSADSPVRRDLLATVPPAVQLSRNLLYGIAERAFARRDGRWKLIVHPPAPPALFDLSNDPEEAEDLAPTRPAIVRRLESRPPALPRAGRDSVIPLTEQDRERLRVLGYGAAIDR